VPPLGGGTSVVYTGRIVRGKNLDVLLRLWPDVVAQIPTARLALVGDGWPGDPVARSLEEVIAGSPLLRRTTTMTGWVPDVTPYLRHADVFVLPSDSEGMSNSLLEACALGRVVVASNIPANRAVLGNDYTLLFDPSDQHAFKSALICALTDERLRAEARAQILDRLPRFHPSAIVDQVEELLIA
jgi:glycosyltransferase involved in cell wall biosynthesis